MNDHSGCPTANIWIVVLVWFCSDIQFQSTFHKIPNLSWLSFWGKQYVHLKGPPWRKSPFITALILFHHQNWVSKMPRRLFFKSVINQLIYLDWSLLNCIFSCGKQNSHLLGSTWSQSEHLDVCGPGSTRFSSSPQRCRGKPLERVFQYSIDTLRCTGAHRQ